MSSRSEAGSSGNGSGRAAARSSGPKLSGGGSWNHEGHKGLTKGTKLETGNNHQDTKARRMTKAESSRRRAAGLRVHCTKGPEGFGARKDVGPSRFVLVVYLLSPLGGSLERRLVPCVVNRVLRARLCLGQPGTNARAGSPWPSTRPTALAKLDHAWRFCSRASLPRGVNS